MTERIIGSIDTYSMLKGGERVTAALSGGADSVCLLLVLKELEEKYNIKVYAVHVNHCIRGEESDRDEQFCRDLCRKLGVELTVRRIDVPAYAADNKLSLEEAARDIRFSVFAEVASGGKLATAHTASDSAETVILNLARGTGLKGICGIPPVRDNIIRPLIDVTRNDVENYLLKRGQNFITDSTNLSVDYTRNRIRHKIIPEILQINSGFYKTFCAELKIFSEENKFIEKFAETAYNICNEDGALCGLQKYDPVIRKRCIAKLLKSKKLAVSSERINSIDEILECGGKINIASCVYAVCRKNVLTIVKENKIGASQSVLLAEGDNTIFKNKIVKAEIKNDGGGIIDLEKVRGDIILRGRNYGDRIKLAGNGFTSSVKKLLNEKIRADIRPFIHFLADSVGVIYIEGIGTAERVKTDCNTSKSLYLTIKDVI